MKITFTPAQMKNLEVFLSRVQLTGAEVGAFQDIVRAIKTPEEEPKKEKDGK